MANSANYNSIKQAMQATPLKALLARISNDTTDLRKLVPLALGTSQKDGTDVEMVLCYQYDAPAVDVLPNFNIKNCRCFPVEKLKNPTNTDSSNPDSKIALVFDFTPINPSSPAWKPELTFKQLKKQNCVEDVEVP
jgi:hypothetical protein